MGKAPSMGLKLNLGMGTVTPEVAQALNTGRPKDALAVLQEKHAQLKALNDKILKAPRAERKALKAEAEALDTEIAALNAAFLRPVDAGLTALQEADTPEAAAEALKMVKEMTANAGNKVMMKRCDDFGAKGIFDQLDKMFTEFGSEAPVAEEGCAALSHLARSPPNREIMGATMVPQVQEMMLHHVGSLPVQQAACRIVTNLSLQHLENAKKLMPLGTMIVKAMQKFPDDTNMQLFGCLAVNNLAINTTELPTWEEGATEWIGIMVTKGRYAEHEGIQQWANSYNMVVGKRKRGVVSGPPSEITDCSHMSPDGKK